jgi:hypothetical protein
MRRPALRALAPRLGAAAALGLLLGACGGPVPQEPVAMQPSDGAPEWDGAPGTAEGAGAVAGTAGRGGDAGAPASYDAVAGASPELRACLTRNDGVGDGSGWGGPPLLAQNLIRKAVDGRLGLDPGQQIERLARGLVSSEETEGRRFYIVVDPDEIDIAVFRRWVRGAARRANEAAGVRGEPVRVTVQESCFPVREYMEAYGAFRTRGVVSVFRSDPALDGRMHGGVCPEKRAAAEALQRELGPIVALDRGCARSV